MPEEGIHEDLLYNTAEEATFVEIPVRFGWLDPDEQRRRGRYLEEITEESPK
ncbi:MAG: hypothetical protein AB1576_13455 [Bacillota bacterium]